MYSLIEPQTPPPAGVYVPVPTFFTTTSPTGSHTPSLDIKTQISHSLHLARSGIRGLVLLGSTGEAIHLSAAEKKSLILNVASGLAEGGFPRYPIIAGVLTNSIEDAIEQLNDAKVAGAQWGLVLAPGYFGTAVNQWNIQEWYKEVADASPIPILIYHYPAVTNNIEISVETYVQLSMHPNIVGAKMSHGDVSRHLQVSLNPEIEHSHFHLYSGFGQQLFPVVSMGAAGVIDGMASFFPKTVVRLFKLSSSLPLDEKKMGEIRKLQFAVSSTEEMVAAYGIVGIREAIFRVLGMGNMEVGRLPLRGSMGHGEWEKWTEHVNRIQKIEDEL